MASGLTLGNLRTLLRQYIDDTNSTRWTDANLNRFLNEGQKLVQNIIDDADEMYFTKCQAYTVAADTDSYEFSLPDDFKKVILVERVNTDAAPTPAEFEDFRRRHGTLRTTHWPYNVILGLGEATWYLRGTKIGMVAPTEAFTVRLWYTYAIPDLSDDAAFSELPNDQRNLVSLLAAKLTKGESIDGKGALPEDLQDMIDFGLAQLKTSIEGRNKQGPRYVTYIPY